jgi:hypothetical protein
LKLAESFLIHQAPLRIGLVLAVNTSAEAIGKTDPGVALLEAYNYAAENSNAQQGLSLITDVRPFKKPKFGLLIILSRCMRPSKTRKEKSPKI